MEQSTVFAKTAQVNAEFFERQMVRANRREKSRSVAGPPTAIFPVANKQAVGETSADYAAFIDEPTLVLPVTDGGVDGAECDPLKDEPSEIVEHITKSPERPLRLRPIGEIIATLKSAGPPKLLCTPSIDATNTPVRPLKPQVLLAPSTTLSRQVLPSNNSPTPPILQKPSTTLKTPLNALPEGTSSELVLGLLQKINEKLDKQDLDCQRWEDNLHKLSERFCGLEKQVINMMRTACIPQPPKPQETIRFIKLGSLQQLDLFNEKLGSDDDFYVKVVETINPALKECPDMDNRMHSALDLIFERRFFAKCSWSGNGTPDSKIPLSKFTHVLTLFQTIGASVHGTPSMDYVSMFFKRKMQDAQERLNSTATTSCRGSKRRHNE